MKDIYIADLANFDEGKLFDGFFLVLAKQQRTTKTNKPYLNLILGDKTGQLEGRVWEPGDPRIAKEFDRGDIVKARGSASRFDDRLQMKVDQLRLAQANEVDKMDMLPSTTYDVSCGASFWALLKASPPRISSCCSPLCSMTPLSHLPTAKRPLQCSCITHGSAGCWSMSSASALWLIEWLRTIRLLTATCCSLA